MTSDIEGLKVLVTGSSTGIGAAVARGFAAAGARVAVHGFSNAQAARDLAAEIGNGSLAVAGDASDSVEMRRVVEEAADGLGGLDCLINNAGALIRRAHLDEIDDALFDQVVNLNIRSVVVASQAARPHLAGSRRASIINTGSIAARHGGGPGSGLYAGAKAFVQAFTRNLAKEFATRGIRVNAVAPGVITTPFHERFSTPEMMDKMRATVPVGRLGTAEECVGAYLFLASPAMSGYVTGQVIEVNGGQIMP